MIRLAAGVEVPGHVPTQHRGRQTEHLAGGASEVGTVSEACTVRGASQVVPALDQGDRNPQP